MTGTKLEAAETIELRYFAALRAKDLEGVLALFAPEASVTLPDGRRLEGASMLRPWFAGLFGAQAPAPSPVAAIGGPEGVAVEIETRLADGSLRRTANFFYLDPEGRIARLSVYARS